MARALLAALLAFVAFAAHAQEKMLFVEYHAVSAKLAPGSAELQNRKLWLVGTKYMRFEDIPNPDTGVHGLIIVAEPDIWIIDRKANRGQHSTDPGPSYAVHFPMFPNENSDRVKQLTFGRELEFFDASGGRELARQTLDGVQCRVFAAEVDGRDLTLYMRGDGKPFQVSIGGGSGDEYGIRYVRYDPNGDPDLSLFKPGPGVRF
jgi:hypothetical protein